MFSLPKQKKQKKLKKMAFNDFQKLFFVMTFNESIYRQIFPKILKLFLKI